jgi:uracil-DNA glycosylase family 4
MKESKLSNPAVNTDFHHIHSLTELNAVMIECRRCPRLVEWREQVARAKRRAYRDWDYWGRPVPGFGDPEARLLVFGLAPAAHGGNRTGRVFTGDSSGNFLYSALYRAGFANQPESVQRGDGLKLNDVYIAAACHCAPPDNKPTREEMDNCRPYFQRGLQLLSNLRGIVALGKIAFDNVLLAYRQSGLMPTSRPSDLRFGHNLVFELGNGLPWLLTSYHPSQQNTQTGRLTQPMFDAVWQQARQRLDG